MYFLPAFLAYYREQGVERFIFVDDASTDGTAAYLAQQPDCMILESPVRFFEPINGERAVYSWRQELMDRFCTGQWTIFADADEFLAPPPGETFASVIAHLEATGRGSIWGVLLDIYPRGIKEIMEPGSTPFDPAGPWYFDAVPHYLSIPGRSRPMGIYSGARARLVAENKISVIRSRTNRVAARLGLTRFLMINNLGKVPLIKWKAGNRWDGAHRIMPLPRPDAFLVILHYKFTADLGRKIRYAIDTGGYAQGSRQYVMMSRLLKRMWETDRSFVCRSSRRVGAHALYESGVGRWKRRPGAASTGGASSLASE